jgi:hypothetical protein
MPNGVRFVSVGFCPAASAALPKALAADGHCQYQVGWLRSAL